jgi:hypothetical protein
MKLLESKSKEAVFFDFVRQTHRFPVIFNQNNFNSQFTVHVLLLPLQPVLSCRRQKNLNYPELQKNGKEVIFICKEYAYSSLQSSAAIIEPTPSPRCG